MNDRSVSPYLGLAIANHRSTAVTVDLLDIIHEWICCHEGAEQLQRKSTAFILVFSTTTSDQRTVYNSRFHSCKSETFGLQLLTTEQFVQPGKYVGIEEWSTQIPGGTILSRVDYPKTFIHRNHGGVLAYLVDVGLIAPRINIKIKGNL